MASTLILALPGAARADGGGGGLEKEVDGYRVKLVFAKPAQVGENQFHIQINDALGMPVTDAQVEVSAMPVEGMDDGHGAEEEELPVGVMTSNNDMDGMEMGSETPETGVMKPNTPSGGHDESESVAVMLEPGHEPGEYEGEMHIEISGEWMLEVHFTVNGETKAVEFPFDVERKLGSNYAILAGFFGINATVIFAAAVLKRKSALRK